MLETPLPLSLSPSDGKREIDFGVRLPRVADVRRMKAECGRPDPGLISVTPLGFSVWLVALARGRTIAVRQGEPSALAYQQRRNSALACGTSLLGRSIVVNIHRRECNNNVDAN